ncbi:L-ascorbate metabolism protein UlaG (beta-lactamase superfamily) [Halorubrum alkaliphilum]|uniref:L-ascorbate metabolism protein UlaG (Beta-lactamase superfamily) n=2 Tax=Halorubrum alkaliphilum TaxID=261290 RepID=A0A8T4GD56_9EURY|nr:L-ascorbate metabolism protein UlaG (beta-lactamase superfamily) [Halorubrum alkaliphilum]
MATLKETAGRWGNMTVRYDGLTVEWLGYATARVAAVDGPTVYTDPGRYGVLDDYWTRDGDLVLVTHDHHYDPEGIRSVADPGATLVIYEAVDPDRIDRDVESVESLSDDYDVIRVDDEAEFEVELDDGTVTVWTVPTYNDPEGPRADADGTVPHPEGFGCGFLFSIGDRTAFWPGDGDALDGFAELDVDLFLANIGGGDIVSDRHESADLAEGMAPELVVPIHYDTFDALEADGEAFAGDVASRSIPAALDERSVNR